LAGHDFGYAAGGFVGEWRKAVFVGGVDVHFG
jgi:hypothetical protein